MRKLMTLSLFGMMLLFTFTRCKKEDSKIQQDREEVVMRKIGHKMLLLSNDSTSLVKPIIHEGDQYRIQFDSSFSFLPDDVIKMIDTIVKASLPYENYLVEVEACDSNIVVYSYEVDVFSSVPFPEEVACRLREQPEACYEVVIRFFREEKSSNKLFYLLLIIPLLVMGAYRYKKAKQPDQDHRIVIGSYLFDPNKMTLTLVDHTIELTSKESELLNLLYASVNNTVDRETILNKVWGDEGDYVGRTLDVYISKLRKKFENDDSIQLKNIRGIGYKLIVEA